MAHYLHYDREYNVVRRLRNEEERKANSLSEEDRAPQKVYFFKMPKAVLPQGGITIGSAISAADQQRSFMGSDSVIFVLTHGRIVLTHG
jgi:hypothetical protein